MHSKVQNTPKDIKNKVNPKSPSNILLILSSFGIYPREIKRNRNEKEKNIPNNWENPTWRSN